MAPCLRASAALVEHPSLSPSVRIRHYRITYDSRSRRSHILFWSHGHAPPPQHNIYLDTRMHTYTNGKNIIKVVSYPLSLWDLTTNKKLEIKKTGKPVLSVPCVSVSFPTSSPVSLILAASPEAKRGEWSGPSYYFTDVVLRWFCPLDTEDA